jgi:pimeloyl-ACP methyl ester carboxylesterase
MPDWPQSSRDQIAVRQRTDAKRNVDLVIEEMRDQVDLLENYKTNIALDPDWQAGFRKHQPNTLIIWGKNDPFFIPPGARAYLNDLPDAKLVWLDSGHFVLDKNAPQVACVIKARFAPSTDTTNAAAWPS